MGEEREQGNLGEERDAGERPEQRDPGEERDQADRPEQRDLGENLGRGAQRRQGESAERPGRSERPTRPESGEPTRCTTEIEVRYAETDQMGVVHHANYVVWFELARTRLCAMSGFHYAEIERLGYLLMVTAVEVRYRRPAHYGDTVQVICWGERLASRGVSFAYEVRRGDELLATGRTEHIWIERGSGRPCRTPERLRAPFERLAGRAPTSGGT